MQGGISIRGPLIPPSNTNYTRTFECHPNPSHGLTLLTLASVGVSANAFLAALIMARRSFRRWSSGLLLHGTFVDGARAALLIPLALSVLKCHPVTRCSLVDTAFLLLATVTSLNLLTASLSDAPLLPPPVLVPTLLSLQDYYEEDANLLAETTAMPDSPQCVLFGTFMVWFAALTINLGPTFLSGALAANFPEPRTPSCPLVRGPARHVVLNILWATVNLLCVALAAAHLRKLKKDLARARLGVLAAAGVGLASLAGIQAPGFTSTNPHPSCSSQAAQGSSGGGGGGDRGYSSHHGSSHALHGSTHTIHGSSHTIHGSSHGLHHAASSHALHHAASSHALHHTGSSHALHHAASSHALHHTGGSSHALNSSTSRLASSATNINHTGHHSQYPHQSSRHPPPVPPHQNNPHPHPHSHPHQQQPQYQYPQSGKYPGGIVNSTPVMNAEMDAFLRQAQRNGRSHIRTLGTLALANLLFWLPLYICALVAPVDIEFNQSNPTIENAYELTLMAAFAHSAAHPILLLLLNQPLRNGLRLCLSEWCCFICNWLEFNSAENSPQHSRAELRSHVMDPGFRSSSRTSHHGSHHGSHPRLHPSESLASLKRHASSSLLKLDRDRGSGGIVGMDDLDDDPSPPLMPDEDLMLPPLPPPPPSSSTHNQASGSSAFRKQPSLPEHSTSFMENRW